MVLEDATHTRKLELEELGVFRYSLIMIMLSDMVNREGAS